MRNLVKLATLPLLIIAIGFLPASAGEGSLALVHPGIDGVTPPEAKKKSQVIPYYPATAKVSRAQGAVVVAATVLRDGSVGNVEIVACNRPNVGFEESALQAVKEWNFKPATKDGDPVDSYTLVHLYFSPPSSRLGGGGGGGSVWADTFFRSDVPISLPGAPGPVSQRGGITLAGHGGGRQPQTFLRPPCGPGPGKCLYDRNKLMREARQRQGEPGPNRPLPGVK